MSTNILKSPIISNRIRKINTGFGWVDHRLVREGYVAQCSHTALALYLFLIVVSDCEGVSWWGEKNIAKHLGMEIDSLRKAKAELEAADLIAYSQGTWQVLQLENKK